MIVLGISMTHDGTLSIIKDGEHIFSLAEERINRNKAYIGFPFKALRYVIEKEIIKADEIDVVAIASSVFLKRWAFTYAFELTENKKYYDVQNEKRPSDFYIDDKDYLNVKSDEDCRRYVDNKVKKLLHDYGIEAKLNILIIT